MGVAAIILGVLGLVGIGIGLPLLKAYLLYGGVACSLAALIVGLIGKRDGASARAGVVLGLVGMLGTVAMFFLFMSRTGEVVAPSPSVIVAPAIR